VDELIDMVGKMLKNRLSIAARVTAFVVLHMAARGSFGAPPAAVPVDVPDVAKTVGVADGG
jgi:hypothetical protein